MADQPSPALARTTVAGRAGGGSGRSELDPPEYLIVCIGKDCRKAKGFADVIAVAGEQAGSLQVPCQSMCHGPVVGVRVAGRLSWHERIRGKKLRRSMVKAVERGRRDGRLRDTEVRKRRNQIRRHGQLRPLHQVAPLEASPAAPATDQ